jgi:hypothetical protein
MEIDKKTLNQNTLHVLGETVQPDFRTEFLTLLEGITFGIYQEFLVKTLLEKPKDHKALFDYGMQKLLTLKNRPDNNLASYFLVLSSLKSLPDGFSDLATDSMVYCENGDDIMKKSQATEILSRYEKIKSPTSAGDLVS